MCPATTDAGNNYDTLCSADILRDVSPETLRKIAAIAKPQVVDDSETLYSIGDPARNVYVVASGRLRFGLGRPSHTRGTIIAAGDILGWAALLEDQPRRIASVIALERCRLLDIEGEALLKILGQD